MMMDAMFEMPSRKRKKFEVTLEYARSQIEGAHLMVS